jgi:hypothetical protein
MIKDFNMFFQFHNIIHSFILLPLYYTPIAKHGVSSSHPVMIHLNFHFILIQLYLATVKVGNSPILSFVACTNVSAVDQVMPSYKLTPYGVKVMFFAAPVHAGMLGGLATKVSPATFQLIGHAITEIVNGGLPESKTGLGSVVAVVPGWNVSVDGSIAYSQSVVASNSKSTASGC